MQVILADDCIGDAVAQKAAALQAGEVRPDHLAHWAVCQQRHPWIAPLSS